jgi:hypothetical protein
VRLTLLPPIRQPIPIAGELCPKNQNYLPRSCAPSRITLSAAVKALKSADIPIGRVEVDGARFSLFAAADSTEQLSPLDQWEAKHAPKPEGRRANPQEAR